MTLLSEKLQHFKSSFDADTPPSILETINRSVSLLQSRNQFDQCLKLDEYFPKFKLTGLDGMIYESDQLLHNSPLIITIIRGGWCPYCMLEMQTWQEYYRNNNEQLNLITVTPEMPQYANSMRIDNQLDFPLIYDSKLQFATKLGLIWKIDNQLKQLLLKWNIDLSERNCSADFTLPVPATFVIDKNYQIKFRFIEEDYSIRAEPEQVIKVYQSLL